MATAALLAATNHPITAVFQCPLVPKHDGFTEGSMLPSLSGGNFGKRGGGSALGSAPPASSMQRRKKTTQEGRFNLIKCVWGGR